MTRIRMRIAALMFLLAFGAAAALADDYRGEVRGSFTRDRPDDDQVGDVDSWQLSGSYYFSPVRTDGRPLAEAAFLDKAGSVSLHGARLDILDDHISSIAASIDYYVPDTIFYGLLAVHSSETLAVSSSGRRPDHETGWSGAFGITPIDGLLITTSATDEGWDPNVAAKYVHGLPDGHFYAASVSFVDPDDDDSNVAVDFDYFLDLTFKVGAGYSEGGDRFTVRAEKFFTSRFALGGQLFTGDGDDGAGVTVAWRF